MADRGVELSPDKKPPHRKTVRGGDELRESVPSSADAVYGVHAELASSLRESETRFRAFTDTASDGILFHHDGQVLDANSRFLELSGYAIDELRELSLLDLVAPEDRELAARHIAASSSESYEVAGLRKDGTTVPLSIRAQDIAFRGAAARAVWVRDLSERQKVLGALQRSEDRYRQLFETCPEGIYVSDLNRRFVAVNPAMVALFGYASRRAMLEIDPEALYAEAANRQAFLERLFADGSVRDYQEVLTTCDGRLLEVRETANLVRDEAGEVTGYQGILRDVSVERRLERQLAQAQKMDAIGRLAGGVAHDFNNVLTAITGFADLALAGLDPDQQAADDVREIQEAAQRGRRLTQQLLGFSRKQVQEPQIVDLNAILLELRHFLERALGTDVEIRFDLDAGLAPVRADPSQIEQVLMNLAINARAAMPEGGRLEIESRMERIGPLDQVQGVAMIPGDYIVLVVRDHGAGMEEATRARAFEPFFSTKAAKGTGLGLATVYGIVKQSGGYVWIDSTPGVGTTVTIYLPRAEGAVVAPPPFPAGAPAAAEPRQRGSETLLLVEDDEGVREFSRRCLEAKGYEVLVAADAVEARRIFERDAARIAMMVTDIVMPNGNGVALARDIEDRRPEIAILLVSGFPDRAQSPDVAGASDYPLLAKPFTVEQLTETVRRLLDQR